MVERYAGRIGAMRSICVYSWGQFICLLVFLTFILSSCAQYTANRVENSETPKKECSNILDVVALGMQLDEAELILCPLIADKGSLPALSYEDEKGGSCYLAFFDLESGKSSGLTAVIYYSPTGEPEVLLPDKVDEVFLQHLRETANNYKKHREKLGLHPSWRRHVERDANAQAGFGSPCSTMDIRQLFRDAGSY